MFDTEKSVAASVATSVAASVAAVCSYDQVGELLEGFADGTCEDLLAAVDGIDRFAGKGLGGFSQSGEVDDNRQFKVNG